MGSALTSTAWGLLVLEVMGADVATPLVDHVHAYDGAVGSLTATYLVPRNISPLEWPGVRTLEGMAHAALLLARLTEVGDDLTHAVRGINRFEHLLGARPGERLTYDAVRMPTDEGGKIIPEGLAVYAVTAHIGSRLAARAETTVRTRPKSVSPGRPYVHI